VIGSEDFPGGQIGTLKEGQEITRRMIAEAETHRADDVAKLHERLDDIARTLPAEVVRQINGTYIKTAEFPALVADAISDSRFAAMKIGARGFWSLLGFLVLLAGLIVTIVTRAH
jgi:hypothetical protein